MGLAAITDWSRFANDPAHVGPLPYTRSVTSSAPVWRVRGIRGTWNEFVLRAITTRIEILRFVPSAGARLVVPLVLVNLVSGILPVAFVVATSIVIGRVPAALEGGLDSESWDSLVAAFVAAAVAFLLIRVLAPVSTTLMSRIRRRVDGELRAEILELVSRTTSIGPMEDQAVLDELASATRQFDDDWNTPGQAVGGFIALLGRYTSLIAFCIILSLSSFWWTGPVIYVTTMVFRYGNRGGLRKYSAVWRTRMPAMRKRYYFRDLSMGDVAAKETRVFGLHGWLDERYTASYWDLFIPAVKARRRIYFYPYLPITAAGLAIIAFIVYRVGQEAVAGTVSLTALALSLQAIMGAIALGGAYEESDVPTQFGMGALEAMIELRKRISQAEEREQAQTAANVARVKVGVVDPETVDIAGLPSSTLEFHKLEFAYPGTRDKVLRGLELEIPAGRSTAIVGVNGAGKTTLVKLLTRLYEPTGGAILADGVNVGLLDPTLWRRQVSVIFQDFVKFEFSAADNIALGAAHAPRDEEAIREAARRAEILSAFDDHPLGLDTPLSRGYRDGIDLSGGQWQRIAIARSLYALQHGAKILVLDEPTSALDVRAEVAFFDRFVELTHGVTSILISHRFSSVRRADHIVVIENGRVSEQGSHSELMRANGHYARLFTLQAERFAKGLSAEGDIVEGGADLDAPIDLEEAAL